MIIFMNWDKIYWKMISATVGSFGLSQFAHFANRGETHDTDILKLIICIPALIALTVIICVTLAYMYDRKYISKDLAVEMANEKQSEDLKRWNEKQSEELKKWIDKRINGKLEKIMEVINKNHKGENNNEQNIKNDN